MSNKSNVSLDVIVLSNTLNDSIYKMNQKCFDSLFKSENQFDINIILVESNKNSQYKYDFHNLTIITPKESFAFHKFINIALKECKSNFIAVCNNDLIFHSDWFTEIYNVSVQNPDIASFSPIDKSVLYMKRLAETGENFYVGWEISKHIAGWCLVFRRELLGKLELFDERFTFYFSDDDYGFTLKRNNIKHALVTKSKVDHLERQVSEFVETDNRLKNFFSLKESQKNNLPTCLKKEYYEYILRTQKMTNDFVIFYEKWGEPLYLLKVSILIVSTSAMSTYLEETIKSALDQTWGNKEIIVVDISANDAIFQLAKSYESDIVKIYKLENVNASHARNFAFEKSDGDIIQYLDSGDFLSKNKIEEQMIMFRRICDNYALIYSGYLLFKDKVDESIALPYIQTSAFSYSHDMIAALSDYCIQKQNLYISNYIIHRDLINRVGKWNVDLSFGDAEEYIIRLMLNANSSFFCNKGVFYYRDLKEKLIWYNIESDNIKSQYLSIEQSVNFILAKKKNKMTKIACATLFVRYLDCFKHDKKLHQKIIKKIKTFNYRLEKTNYEKLSDFSKKAFCKIKKVFSNQKLS